MEPSRLPQLAPLRAERTSGERSIARPEDVALDRIGRTIKGKWRLDSIVGSGGAATVYAATHRNGNRVAIKVLHPCFASQGLERERFLREGFLSNKVTHPGVVRVLDEDVDEEDNPFLVMELLEGEPLVARWEAAGYRLPVAEALWIIERVLAVLEVSHAESIVHRDIKPENLFLTEDGGIKVLDFGIARLASQGSGTMQGFVLGTPGFAAPEQARGEWHLVDARADLWAVGATLFALLTGRLVHDSATARTQLVRVSYEPAPPVRQVAPDLPEVVARLIDRALAFRREDRFANAAEMRRATQAAFRLVIGRPMTSARPYDVKAVPQDEPTLRPVSAHAPVARVVTPVPSAATPIDNGSSSTLVTRAPSDKWMAVVAAACFVLGGWVVGYLGSTRGEVETAQTAALVSPGLIALPGPMGPGERTPNAAIPRVETYSAAATTTGTANAAFPLSATPAVGNRRPVVQDRAERVVDPIAALPSAAGASESILVRPDFVAAGSPPAREIENRLRAVTAPAASVPHPPSRISLKRPAAMPSGDNFDFMETRH